MEENLRRAMVISGGDPTIFVRRPIALGLLLATLALVLLIVVPRLRNTREAAFRED
jgi:TctA family transporter